MESSRVEMTERKVFVRPEALLFVVICCFIFFFGERFVSAFVRVVGRYIQVPLDATLTQMVRATVVRLLWGPLVVKTRVSIRDQSRVIKHLGVWARRRRVMGIG